MLIAIDCGNTNTVIGLHEGVAPNGDFRHVYRRETDAALWYHVRRGNTVAVRSPVPYECSQEGPRMGS